MYIQEMIYISHDVYDQSSCKIAKMANCHVPDDPMLPFPEIIPLIHRPRKILNRLSKTMHSAASLRKKGKTLSLPLHAHSKHMGRRNILLGQGIF